MQGMFGKPGTMAPGPFLIALHRSSATAPTPEVSLMTVMQRPCSEAFIIGTETPEAAAIGQILSR